MVPFGKPFPMEPDYARDRQRENYRKSGRLWWTPSKAAKALGPI
jgi:hypothetical protein